ncbi:MAG: hypothetical protein ACK4NX_02095 [Candidatus Paceibacteria bacterium]
MKKILWVSQHVPLPRQLEALERLFGAGTIVQQDPRPFSSAEDIANRYREGGYDDIVVVAPLSVIGRLVDLGIRPLWSEMQQVDPKTGNPDIVFRGRGYKFVKFRRVKTLRLEFEELECSI